MARSTTMTVEMYQTMMDREIERNNATMLAGFMAGVQFAGGKVVDTPTPKSIEEKKGEYPESNSREVLVKYINSAAYRIGVKQQDLYNRLYQDIGSATKRDLKALAEDAKMSVIEYLESQGEAKMVLNRAHELFQKVDEDNIIPIRALATSQA